MEKISITIEPDPKPMARCKKERWLIAIRFGKKYIGTPARDLDYYEACRAQNIVKYTTSYIVSLLNSIRIQIDIDAPILDEDIARVVMRDFKDDQGSYL